MRKCKNSPLPGLDALVQGSPAALSLQLGAEAADVVMGYLRHNPGVVQAVDAGRLALARDRLDASVAAYRASDHSEAKHLPCRLISTASSRSNRCWRRAAICSAAPKAR